MPSVWSLLEPASPQASAVAVQPILSAPKPGAPLATLGASELGEKLACDTYLSARSMPGAWTSGHLKAAPDAPASPMIKLTTPKATSTSATAPHSLRPGAEIDPKFVSWLSSLYALPQALRGATSYLASAAMGAAGVGMASSPRSEAWRAREEMMVQSAWQLEQILPLTAKVGLIRTMKAGALSSGAYSLVLPWVIFTYPVLGLFTPVIVGVLFGVSVGLGALAQEWSRKLAVRADRRGMLPRYDENLQQLIALQLELKALKVGRPLSSREHVELKAARALQAELTALSATRPLRALEEKKLKDAVATARACLEVQQGRELDLRETQQLKQLNALRLRYEGGFRNLMRQAVDAVIDGYAVPELHLGSNA